MLFIGTSKGVYILYEANLLPHILIIAWCSAKHFCALDGKNGLVLV